MRAVASPASGKLPFLDPESFAGRAELSLPSVYLQKILHIAMCGRTRLIGPDGGAVVFDGEKKYASCLFQNPPAVFEGESPGRKERRDSGGKESLVGIDVSYPRDDALIHDHFLDWPPDVPCQGEKFGRLHFERLLPQGGQGTFLVFFQEVASAELPDVIEGKAAIFPMEGEEEGEMPSFMSFFADDEEFPFHPEMEQKLPFSGEMKEQILPPSVDGKDLLSREIS